MYNRIKKTNCTKLLNVFLMQLILALTSSCNSVHSKNKIYIDKYKRNSLIVDDWTRKRLNARSSYDKGEFLWNGSEYNSAKKAVELFSNAIDIWEQANTIALKNPLLKTQIAPMYMSHWKRGVAYVNLIRYTAAINDLDIVINDNLKNNEIVQVYLYRAIAMQRTNDIKSATKDIKLARNLNKTLFETESKSLCNIGYKEACSWSRR